MYNKLFTSIIKNPDIPLKKVLYESNYIQSSFQKSPGRFKIVYIYKNTTFPIACPFSSRPT